MGGGSRPPACFVDNRPRPWEGFLAKPCRNLLDCRKGRTERMNRMPAVRVGAGAALAAVARQILSEARDALDDRARSDAVAVHEYRKDMKRWRALPRPLAPGLG